MCGALPEPDRQKPFAFQVTLDNQPNYFLRYVEETRACGHTLLVYPRKPKYSPQGKETTMNVGAGLAAGTEEASERHQVRRIKPREICMRVYRVRAPAKLLLPVGC